MQNNTNIKSSNSAKIKMVDFLYLSKSEKLIIMDKYFFGRLPEFRERILNS